MEIYNVVMKERLALSLKKLPKHIVAKLTAWINAVGHDGLSEVRKIAGFHDEPLKGLRKGQHQSLIELFILLIKLVKWKLLKLLR